MKSNRRKGSETILSSLRQLAKYYKDEELNNIENNEKKQQELILDTAQHDKAQEKIPVNIKNGTKIKTKRTKGSNTIHASLSNLSKHLENSKNADAYQLISDTTDEGKEETHTYQDVMNTIIEETEKKQKKNR